MNMKQHGWVELKKQIKTKHPCEFAAGSVSLSLSLQARDGKSNMLSCCIHSVCIWNFTWFIILVHIPTVTVVASIHVQSSFWTYDASLLLLVPSIWKYRPVKQLPNNLAAAHQPIRLIFFTMIVRLSCGLARRETTPWIVDCGLIWKTCLCCTSKMFKHGVSWGVL